jgi:hypothetical protein
VDNFADAHQDLMIIPHFRAILGFAMMIQIKSMMRRRVNRVRPSGLVCP